MFIFFHLHIFLSKYSTISVRSYQAYNTHADSVHRILAYSVLNLLTQSLWGVLPMTGKTCFCWLGIRIWVLKRNSFPVGSKVPITEMTAAIELPGIRRKVGCRLLLEFQCASDATSNFLVLIIINVSSLSRLSRHEKKCPMSPYGDYNKERVYVKIKN